MVAARAYVRETVVATRVGRRGSDDSTAGIEQLNLPAREARITGRVGTGSGQIVKRLAADGNVLEVAEVDCGSGLACADGDFVGKGPGRLGLGPAALESLADLVLARRKAVEVEIAPAVSELRRDERAGGIQHIDLPVIQSGVARAVGSASGQIVVDNPGDVAGRIRSRFD